MNIEVRHLRIVDAIAREGTVTRAAEKLFVTQPAVSRALKELETRIGTPLFRREARRMALTLEGERLRTTAKIVLDEIDRVEHDLDLFKNGVRGIVRLTTQCYTCYHWLPKLIRVYSEQFPEVDIQIVPEAKSETYEGLLDDRIDLGIVHLDPPSDDILLEPLFHDELVAVVETEHPWASRSYVTPADFGDVHLLVHQDYDTSFIRNELLRPAGVEPRRVSELQLTEAVVECVKAGIGVSVMAEWAVQPEVQCGSIRTVRITEEGLLRNWSAAVTRNKARQPAIRHLVGLLKEQAFSAVAATASV